MTRRKRMLIRIAVAAIAEHNRNLDYDTRELYYQFRDSLKYLDSRQLALVLLLHMARDNAAEKAAKKQHELQQVEANPRPRRGLLSLLGR